jgi:hypothetical protein
VVIGWTRPSSLVRRSRVGQLSQQHHPGVAADAADAMGVGGDFDRGRVLVACTGRGRHRVTIDAEAIGRVDRRHPDGTENRGQAVVITA